MASPPLEDGAGPSGLSHDDIISLLGLNTSDSEPEHETPSCHGHLLSLEEMPDSDDDLCHEAMDHLERQHAFQTHLLVAEVWIPRSEQERLTLNSNPLLIVRVAEWGYVNDISLPVYVKGGT